MDFFLPIVIILIAFVIFTVCGWCFKRKRDGTIFQNNTPVQHHIPTATPQVVPPYPIDARHPTPQAPGPGFVHAGSYQAPYPTGNASGMPYPAQHNMPYPPQGGGGYHPQQSSVGVAPYPPVSGTNYTSPPSYSEAMGQPIPSPVPPQTTTEKYAKQAPYNPNY